jgi:G3E family GTPase
MPAQRFRPRAGKIQMILTSTLSGFRAPAVIPVFLITGALGSGKTTLLRELLACPDMQDTALIINEFGAIGLDQMLVQSAIENILLMEDGCLCCSIRGDLIDTIGGLFARMELGEIPSFGRIIVETTGLADPGQIIQDLVTARGVANRIRLAKVVTTVDGVLGLSQLDQNEEVVQQVIHADLCMITKCDLIDGETLSVLTRAISGFNPAAEIVRSNDPGSRTGRVLAETAWKKSRSAGGTGIRCDGGEDCDHGPGCNLAHAGLANLASRSSVHQAVQSWSIRHSAPLAWPKVREWLDALYSMRPANVLRMKGILHLEGETKPVVIQGVGAMINDIARLEDWPGPRPGSEIVVITKDLEAEAVGRSFEAIVLDKRLPRVGSVSIDGHARPLTKALIG